MILATIQTGVSQVDMNTMISLATVVVLIGVAWRLSGVLTKICVQLEPLVKLPAEVATLKREVREVRSHIEGLEEDVSFLWTSQRGESPDQVRHRSRRPWAGDSTPEEI